MKKFLKSILDHIVFVVKLYRKLDSKQREKLWINLMIAFIILVFFIYMF